MTKSLSQMLAIPANQADLDDPRPLLIRLTQCEGLTMDAPKSEDDGLHLELQVDGQDYRVLVYPTEFEELPELYRVQHLLPDMDVRELQNAGRGLAVEMTFGDNPLASYHVQLRILHAMLPDAVAILDDSSEKLLSGRWAALAAESQTPPAPRYLYTAQAVSDEDGCVWLHTHGLNRCGLPELEVLNSRAETCQNHYQLLEVLANRLLEQKEPPTPGDPIFLARLTEDDVLVVTLMDWREAVERYPADMLGGKSDRETDHNQNTCAVFAYPSPEDCEARRYAPISLYDGLLEGNPLYMISNAETQRMKALAAERMGYMLQAAQDARNHVLVKLGLDVDVERRTNSNSKEHIWFELLRGDNSRLTAKLTQEPYYIADLHEGDVGLYPLEDVTDWIIYAPDHRVTPDDVYLLSLL